MTDDPRQALADGQRLLDSGEPAEALAILEPLTAHPDAEIAAGAWIAVGTARYREDDEAGALTAWQRAADLGGPLSWLGWRSVAEQHVRNGDLEEATDAYREADRRAPPQERGAIANRIAWLLKETGHDFAARRQFNRARGAYATFPAYVTWAIIAINVAVFIADASLGGFSTIDLISSGGPLVDAGAVARDPVANGEWWRLITSAFLHLGPLHLAFNMYLLWLFGPVIEQLYGHLEFVVLYLLCALGGSVLTIVAAPDTAAAGASGAIFGLFGLAFVVSRRRHLLLGPQARGILSQAGGLLVLNLIITFAVPFISWTGHVGGLLVGALIGMLLAPANVPTLGGLWRTPDGKALAGGTSGVLRAGAYVLVAAILAGGTLYAINQVG
jgi:membrane associated rhomboid family serine protease